MGGYQDDIRFMLILEVFGQDEEKEAIQAWNNCKLPYKTLLRSYYGD